MAPEVDYSQFFAQFAARGFWTLVLMAAGFLVVVYAYQVKRPRPLPRRRRLAWLPKYWLEVPLRCDPADREAVTRVVREWLEPLGMELRADTDEQLLFGRGSRLGLLAGVRVLLSVPLPAADPARVEIRYESGVLLDTGDLCELGRQLRDSQQSPPRTLPGAAVETGNPYQTPLH